MKPVCFCAAVMVKPGTAAEEGSVTVPVRTADATWALAETASSSARREPPARPPALRGRLRRLSLPELQWLLTGAHSAAGTRVCGPIGGALFRDALASQGRNCRNPASSVR